MKTRPTGAYIGERKVMPALGNAQDHSTMRSRPFSKYREKREEDKPFSRRNSIGVWRNPHQPKSVRAGSPVKKAFKGPRSIRAWRKQ
jgi:hypothetical protein